MRGAAQCQDRQVLHSLICFSLFSLVVWRACGLPWSKQIKGKHLNLPTQGVRKHTRPPIVKNKNKLIIKKVWDGRQPCFDIEQIGALITNLHVLGMLGGMGAAESPQTPGKNMKSIRWSAERLGNQAPPQDTSQYFCPQWEAVWGCGGVIPSLLAHI